MYAKLCTKIVKFITYPFFTTSTKFTSELDCRVYELINRADKLTYSALFPPALMRRYFRSGVKFEAALKGPALKGP